VVAFYTFICHCHNNLTFLLTSPPLLRLYPPALRNICWAFLAGYRLLCESLNT
jgi:hypothetical protein